MAIIDGVLNTSLPKFSGVYLDDRRRMSVGQAYFENLATAKAYAELFEQLLLFNKVSIVLQSMDNSAIAALISGFGMQELERALALEAVEIIQPSALSMAGMGQFGRGEREPDLLTGLPPVVYGRVHGGIYGDPEEAILDSFRYLQGISIHEQRAFARRIAQYIKPGPAQDGDRAVKIVTDAYNSDLLRTVGVPNTGLLTTLDADKRIRIQELTSEIEQAIFVADNNYALYNTPKAYNIAKDAVGRIENALELQRGNDAILDGIRIPNLRVLFMSGKATLDDALRLREGTENIGFRQWLQTISNTEDARLVMRQYIEAVSRPTGFIETIPGQSLKGVTMYGIGKGVSAVAAIAGTIIGGPVGGIIGGAIGAAAEPVVSGIVEIASNMLLDRMSGAVLRGWTPKLFIDQIQSMAESQSDLNRLGL